MQHLWAGAALAAVIAAAAPVLAQAPMTPSAPNSAPGGEPPAASPPAVTTPPAAAAAENPPPRPHRRTSRPARYARRSYAGPPSDPVANQHNAAEARRLGAPVAAAAPAA